MQLSKQLLFTALLGIYSFFNPLLLTAQSNKFLSGTVSATSEKEPLVGAAIYALTNKSKAATSDANGHFSLQLSAEDKVVICTFIGMLNDTFYISETNENELIHNFVLRSTETQLQTIVVSAGEFEQKLEEKILKHGKNNVYGLLPPFH